MSELKVYHCNEWHNHYTEFYIKSEADKVIAELKDDCAYWKVMAQKNAEDNVVMAKQRAEAFKRERHHKYKRCLAMALLWLNRAENSTDLENELVSRKRCCKWMELAEKFKETK